MERLEPVQGVDLFDPSQDPAISAAAGVDTNLLRGEVGLPTKQEDALAELKAQLAALQSKSSSSLGVKVPDFDESFSKYQKQLRNVYG